jgi:hypothetical protein
VASDQSSTSEHADLHERIVELGARLHGQELTSAESLGTRAGTLIGFSGVVLALTASLAGGASANNVNLGRVGNPASAFLFLLAVTCLLAAATQAVRAAAPRARGRVNVEILDTYREELPSVADANEHVGRKQQDVTKLLAGSNSDRAATLQWAFRWLLVALALVAGQAAIIGIDRLSEVL